MFERVLNLGNGDRIRVAGHRGGVAFRFDFGGKLDEDWCGMAAIDLTPAEAKDFQRLVTLAVLDVAAAGVVGLRS